MPILILNFLSIFALEVSFKLFSIMVTSYDFPRPRVRKNGKFLDKFSLAYELVSLCPSIPWTVIYDVYSYAELRARLIKYIIRKS